MQNFYKKEDAEEIASVTGLTGDPQLIADCLNDAFVKGRQLGNAALEEIERRIYNELFVYRSTPTRFIRVDVDPQREITFGAVPLRVEIVKQNKETREIEYWVTAELVGISPRDGATDRLATYSIRFEELED